MAKRPKKKNVSAMSNIDRRRRDNEDVAALLGTRGHRRGRADLTEAEKNWIRTRDPKKRMSASDKRYAESVYRKTKRSQDERTGAR